MNSYIQAVKLYWNCEVDISYHYYFGWPSLVGLAIKSAMILTYLPMYDPNKASCHLIPKYTAAGDCSTDIPFYKALQRFHNLLTSLSFTITTIFYGLCHLFNLTYHPPQTMCCSAGSKTLFPFLLENWCPEDGTFLLFWKGVMLEMTSYFHTYTSRLLIRPAPPI